MNEILLESLYQGNRDDAIKASQNKSVTSILYLGQEIPEELTHKSLIPVIHIPIRNDFEEDPLRFEYIFQYLDYALKYGSIVLVACRYGESRSPLVCLYYLMLHEHYSYKRAYTLIKSKVSNFKSDRKLNPLLRNYVRGHQLGLPTL